MKYLLQFILFLVFINSTFSQINLNSNLNDILKWKEDLTETQFNLRMDQSNYIHSDSALYLELIDTKESDFLEIQKYENLFESISSTYKNRISGWVNYDYLTKFDQFNSIMLIPSIHESGDMIDNEGPLNMNTTSYNNSNTGGNGINVAIIDGNYWNYANAVIAGVVPASVTYTDYINSGNTTPTGSNSFVHGTACTEIVFDHVPAANYFLYRVGNLTDRVNAYIDAAENNVQLISNSQSGYNTGWDDGTGVLCDGVDDMLNENQNMLLFISSGNRNGTHWQGDFNQNDTDIFHEWSGSDETNNFFLGTLSRGSISLQFDGIQILDFYDIQLVEITTGTLIDPSTGISRVSGGSSTTGFETLSIDSCSNCNNGTVGLRVISKGPTTPQFEFWKHNVGGNLEYSSNNNQPPSPANCQTNHVIPIAAVEQSKFNLSNPTVEPYSSVGPTNGGVISVYFTAPDSNSTFVYQSSGNPNGFFSGTSCSTPNAMGATAAFWAKHSNLDADEIREILIAKAINYKDWGSSGQDDVFGYGGMYLHDYDSDNIYLHQFYGTNGVAPSNGIYPWDNLSDINNLAPTDKKVILLTDDFVSPPETLDKKMVLKSSGVNKVE